MKGSPGHCLLCHLGFVQQHTRLHVHLTPEQRGCSPFSMPLWSTQHSQGKACVTNECTTVCTTGNLLTVATKQASQQQPAPCRSALPGVPDHKLFCCMNSRGCKLPAPLLLAPPAACCPCWPTGPVGVPLCPNRMDLKISCSALCSARTCRQMKGGRHGPQHTPVWWWCGARQAVQGWVDA